MATFTLESATILFGGVDLSSLSNQVAVNYEVETNDATTFTSGGTRVAKGGLWTVGAEVSGFTDDEVTGALVFDAVGSGPTVLQITPTGVDGERGFAFKSVAASHQPVGGSIGEIAASSLSLSGRSGAPLVQGSILHPSGTARTATATGTGRELGAVASDEKVYGALNVVEVSGTSPTLDVLVQSAAASDFAGATTRLTFTEQGAVGGEWQEAAGAITDEWWRISYTIGGTDTPSFKFGVTVGIR